MGNPLGAFQGILADIKRNPQLLGILAQSMGGGQGVGGILGEHPPQGLAGGPPTPQDGPDMSMGFPPMPAARPAPMTASAPRMGGQQYGGPRASGWRDMARLVAAGIGDVRGGNDLAALRDEWTKRDAAGPAAARQQELMTAARASITDPREWSVFLADPEAWAKSRAKGYEPQVAAAGSSVYEGGKFQQAPLASMTVQPGGAVYNPTTRSVDYQAPFKPEIVTTSPGETATMVTPGAPSAAPAIDEQTARGVIGSLFPGAMITSGARTPQHNADVGGVPTSYHLAGQALDIVPPKGVSLADFRAKLQAQGVPVTELLDEGDHIHWAFGQPRGGATSQVVQQSAAKPVGSRPMTDADRQTWGIPAGIPGKIDLATGEPSVISGASSALPKPPPRPVQTAYRENNVSRLKIDRALAGLAARPQSLGTRFIAGEWVNQRTDPEGVDVRANIADIGSLMIHDRSGAAVTVSESPRLKPFVPLITDTPDAAKKKLLRLRQAIDDENGFIEYEYPDVGQPGMGARGEDVANDIGAPAPAAPAAATRGAPRKGKGPVQVRSLQEAQSLPPGTEFVLNGRRGRTTQ